MYCDDNSVASFLSLNSLVKVTTHERVEPETTFKKLNFHVCIEIYELPR